ncbi:MAG: hypothetical protein ABL995_14115 [Bryobacteraceae bacterium]
MHAQVTVPFVGCPSDGQACPVAAPQGKPVTLPIPKVFGRKVAWYSSFENGMGVLAPAGWHCSTLYGSSGDLLTVRPNPFDTWGAFTGPGIRLAFTTGQGSGGYEVVRLMSLLFPRYNARVQGLMKAEPEGTGNFKLGPFKTDRIIRRGATVVEYRTPADTEGLGTQLLRADRLAIEGVVILTGTNPDMTHLAVRLPEEWNNLAPIIMDQAKRDAAKLR